MQWEGSLSRKNPSRGFWSNNIHGVATEHKIFQNFHKSTMLPMAIAWCSHNDIGYWKVKQCRCAQAYRILNLLLNKIE